MLTLTACNISGNSAHALGGGVYNQAMATFTGCTISGDSAAQNGGGLVTGLGATSALLACTITGNTAMDGAGLENYATTMLTNCTLSGNIALGRWRRSEQLRYGDASRLHDQRQHSRTLGSWFLQSRLPR